MVKRTWFGLSPTFSGESSLWATAALHLWGVQVTGLAASGQGVCLEVDSSCKRDFGENVVEGSSLPL